MFQKQCINHDKSASTSNISSSDRSASCTDLKMFFIRWLKPSIYRLATLCALSALDCTAAALSADASPLKNLFSAR